jgi:hypothetical protein
MKVTLAYQDDEQGLYVDGILVLKGRDIDMMEIFQALEISFEDREVDFDWFWNERDGKFPRVMNRVKFE